MSEPYISGAERRWADEAGLCQNCFHTMECDALDVQTGRRSCGSEKNSMEHECPRNLPSSRDRYDRLVMRPIREYLAGRNRV